MRIFMDTGAFIALVDVDDRNHDSAKAFYEKGKERGVKFITTNFVICETMNYIRARVSHEVAVMFWEKVKKSTLLEIMSVTPMVENAAFRIFKQYADKDFSFTDCTSFALMESIRLTNSFAFDKHFEQYGNFSRLP